MKVDFYTVWNVVFLLFLLCVFLYLLLGYLLFIQYNLLTFNRSVLVQGCGTSHSMNIRQYNTIQCETRCLYSYKNVTQHNTDQYTARYLCQQMYNNVHTHLVLTMYLMQNSGVRVTKQCNIIDKCYYYKEE
jgi:hypothetical protein